MEDSNVCWEASELQTNVCNILHVDKRSACAKFKHRGCIEASSGGPILRFCEQHWLENIIFKDKNLSSIIENPEGRKNRL